MLGKTEMLRDDVQRLQVILSSVDRLAAALRAECRPSLALALAEAADLMQLASWLEAHGPAMIAGIAVSDEGCVLQHLALSVDQEGWPIAQSIDGPTLFSAARASEFLDCYLSASRAATAPVALLDGTTVRAAQERVTGTDAPAVLRAVRRAGRGKIDP